MRRVAHSAELFFSGAGKLRRLPGNATLSILGLLSRSFVEVNNVVALAWLQ